ncbi:unnamed protein product [Didymodactylos carnosus]|uniref:Uncharacterized protein n=1 Tax=Didymodactylos carnosus TaxID=1234261 RepID=A0A815PUG4_9BILA|nr:unnamed protein product [Didymodactylos carnosus]CAF1453741.1 unnamed protein product [Didymodactylos carnosus]CAF4094045.1 unnamed protein product [Didymodactylos carnosus]CAF4326271.1 unnamed protein product [Didymodactylos carnosus]
MDNKRSNNNNNGGEKFFTEQQLANNTQGYLYFYWLMVLKMRSEAVYEPATSIRKGHIHNNRALDHVSLEDEAMLRWNAPPLHLVHPFIKQSINNYFS